MWVYNCLKLTGSSVGQLNPIEGSFKLSTYCDEFRSYITATLDSGGFSGRSNRFNWRLLKIPRGVRDDDELLLLLYFIPTTLDYYPTFLDGENTT